MRATSACLLFACGCNQLLGLDPVSQTIVDANLMDADLRADLDADGLPDVLDPCIAGPIDELLDLDFDEVPSGVDGCPFDANEHDFDQDGVVAACDAFPELAGDRRRCVMNFRDIDLNPLLWHPRAGEDGWNVPAMRTTGSRTGTILAVAPLEAPTLTTYVLYGLVGPTQPQGTASLRMIVRGVPGDATRDAGCELIAGEQGFEIVVIPDGARTPIAQSTTSQYFTLRASFVPTDTGSEPNVRCDLVFPIGVQISASDRVTLPPGRAGFSATNLDVTIVGFGVYERANAPL